MINEQPQLTNNHFKKLATNNSVLRRRTLTMTSFLCVALLVTACSSSSKKALFTNAVPKPNNILVYSFVPTEQTSSIKQTQIGRELAVNLVKNINVLGVPARQATPETSPQLNDIIIRGKILSMDEGNSTDRVALGFGEGASELNVQFEIFQTTSKGEQKLAGDTYKSEGSKKPGAALGVVSFIASQNPAGLIINMGRNIHDEETGSSAVEGRTKEIAETIADQLNMTFQKQGWI